VQAAGLADVLKSGEYTVLAPTDAAFAKLPAGTVETLLKPENKETLRGILLYHVVKGSADSRAVAKLKFLHTLQGSRVTVDATNGVKLNDATVVMPDVLASNGIIHVIDTVLLPPAK
jgi:uncharacterized surface protein with fasciclin (FAS1) repeats